MERKKLIYAAIAVTTSIALGVGYVLRSRNVAPTLTGNIEPTPETQPTKALPALSPTPVTTIKSPDTGATYELEPNGCVIVGKTEVGNLQTAFGASRALGYPKTEVVIYRDGQEMGKFGSDTNNKITTENVGGVYQPNEIEVCPVGK